MEGNEVAMVEVSCTAKPCERSSRCIRFRWPPDFGVSADASDAAASTARADSAAATMRERLIVFLSYERRPREVGGIRDTMVGKPGKNIRYRPRSDNCSAPRARGSGHAAR